MSLDYSRMKQGMQAAVQRFSEVDLPTGKPELNANLFLIKCLSHLDDVRMQKLKNRCDRKTERKQLDAGRNLW